MRYMFLLLPIVFFWVVLSFFNHFQTGIRHILFLFPLLFIGLGFLFKKIKDAAKIWQVIVAILVLYTFSSVAVYYPYIIPYTNEFIANKNKVYQKIYDSSIDYGQSDSSLNIFLARHPDYKAATPWPSTGKYAVRMNQVFNTHHPEWKEYKWYRSMKPTDQYRYTILLFNITEQDLKLANYANTDIKIIK